MSNRVTDALMYGKGQQAMVRSRDKMIKNQEQSVSGLRVNKPSDDPVASMRAVGLKVADKRNEQIATNMQLGRSLLSLADGSLSELNDLLARAKELAIQMSSSSNAGNDSREAVANEIEQLQLRAVQIGNTRFGDRFIFGGHQTERAPFDENGNYYGDGQSIQFEIDRGQKMAISIPGNAAFLGQNELPPEAEMIRQDPLMDGVPSIEAKSSLVAAPPTDPAGAAPGAGKKPASEGSAEAAENKEAMAFAPKSVNIFSVLKDFAGALRKGNRNGIHEALDGLDKSFQQVLETRTLIGARMNVIESGISASDNARVSNAERLSEVQDADTLKVFSDLAKNEHALNASLQTSSKLLTPSLLNFLK